MDQNQLPTSLREVEALVLQLYQPGASEKVAKTQETLQQLQRSSEGWRMADSLLGHKEEQVRFFGALTFIVKLNTDSKSLSEEDAESLLQNLIHWLIQCLENSGGPLVPRKLCSTLVVYFLHFSTSWTRCIKHLMYCLCINKAVPYKALKDAPETAVLVRRISDDKAVSIFWFAASLVEEIGKTDSNSMKQHKFHQRVAPNVEEIVPLIARYVASRSPGISASAKVRQESMRCFQSWVSYSHRAFIDDEIILEPLRALSKPAIWCLLDDELYEIAIELFSDILSNYSKFLHEEDFKLLYSIFNGPWAQARYERLIKGDFEFESLQFGLFMIAFGDAIVEDLAQHIEADVQSQQFLSVLCGLLGADGFAVSQDKIFVPALEFWNTFVETMIDFTYSVDGGNPPWFPAAGAYVLQAIEKCWHKIQFPPAEVFSSWDSVDRTGFKDARRDVSDLLQQFYLITGIRLLSVFTDLALQSVNPINWTELEASFYCLAQYPDCVAEEEHRDEYLHKVFDLSLFSLLTNSTIQVPTRTMQTFLTLINGYADYFERHTKYLASALNLAFGVIEVPTMAKSASRTIVQLCSSCRKILIPELGAFLQQYGNIAHLSSSLDSYAKEGIMEGIASVIQAIPDDESKVAPLEQLLQFVELDIERSLSLTYSQPSMELLSGATVIPHSDTSASNYNAASELGLLSLRCLASIARGLQVPNDIPVDLERRAAGSPFWTTGGGSVIQQKIFLMICRTYDSLRNRGDILDAACYVFRAGFIEHEPGPFVFPANTVAKFLLKADFKTPRLGIAISTACSLISSHVAATGARIDEILSMLLTWVAQMLQSLGEPSNDPEIAQNGIDFLYRLIPSYSSVFLNHEPASSLEFLFLFTLKALTGSDPLPKSTAADFWSSFVAITTQEDQLQLSINNALQHLGPHLAQAIIFNIGGNAARSELDKVSEPLKKLVVRQMRSRSWLEAALLDKSFPSDMISVKDRLVFLQKIMNLRGARGTNQVVRDFWLACRGTNFAYAS